LGPVGYYVGQVSNDKCPIGVCTALHPLGVVGNTQRYDLVGLGGLVEYNFGPASLTVWATQEVYARSSGAFIPAGVVGAAAVDPSNITKGMTVFATLSYRIWAPEEPPKAPMIRK